MSSDNFDRKPLTDNLRSVISFLNTLKTDYQNTLKLIKEEGQRKANETKKRANQDDQINEQYRKDISVILEKIKLVQKAIAKIENSNEEGEMIMLFATYLEEVQVKMYRMKLEMKQLISENDLLKTENMEKAHKLQVTEEKIIELETERDHFKFMYELSEQGGIADSKPL